jgi:hypothetical protein
MSEVPPSDDRRPETPHDPGWWSAFGEALLTGDFESEVDPEVRASMHRWRSRATAVASAAFEVMAGRRLDELEARLAEIERRLSRFDGSAD